MAQPIFPISEIRACENNAINTLGIPASTLMQRAGLAVFNQLILHWPKTQSLTVLCGHGNNGGDGYIVARIAFTAGLQVKIVYLKNPSLLPTAALEAYQDCKKLNIPMELLKQGMSFSSDIIIDALLGIGAKGMLAEPYRLAIETINKSSAKKISIDLPSGIDADTGQALGDAVKADLTITFIGMKQGLLTGQAPALTGNLLLDELQLSAELLDSMRASGEWFNVEDAKKSFQPRPRDAHKGNFGHVLIIGGDKGMAGAVTLAAGSALRVGAGLVSVATRQEHISIVTQRFPETMCHGIENIDDIFPLLDKANTVVIGPGLGQSEWSKHLFKLALESKRPLIIDADGLNLLSQNPRQCEQWILTPHPGEAARLLNLSTHDVQANRFAAVTSLQEKYQGVTVLKGAGTIVLDNSKVAKICSEANPGLASGGMGDVLSGIIGGLVAQGFSLSSAAILGVRVHAEAGRLAAQNGERGMLASDVINELRSVVN